MREWKRHSWLVAICLLVISGVWSSTAGHEGQVEAAEVPRGEAARATLFEVWQAAVDANEAHGQRPSSEAEAMPRTNCELGFAGPYPCDQVDLMAFVPTNTLSGGGTGNDLWGWTDPESGREFAIMGHSLATSFTEVTDPENPVYLGHLPSHSLLNALWRDVKVYENHAFIVADFPAVEEHGLQIFDLTELLDVALPPMIFSETTHYDEFNNAHNIGINEETGFAYVVGSDSCEGGLHMVNIQHPVNPSFAGCYDEDGYTHDVQCVIYDGPDAAHQGNEICMAANEDTLTIVDVTNKSSPAQLAREGYDGHGYTHQGWLTEDHAYFLLGDELDEQNNGHNTHTYIWDVRDLDNPVLIDGFVGPTTAIDHNLYIKGDLVYEANYQAGLRIMDIRDIENANLNEVAYFDTFPAGDAAAYAGSWSVYPYFESGNVIVSNIFGDDPGLFILRPHDGLPGPLPTATATSTGGPLPTPSQTPIATASPTFGPSPTATATRTPGPPPQPTLTGQPTTTAVPTGTPGPLSFRYYLPVLSR